MLGPDVVNDFNIYNEHASDVNSITAYHTYTLPPDGTIPGTFVWTTRNGDSYLVKKHPPSTTPSDGCNPETAEAFKPTGRQSYVRDTAPNASPAISYELTPVSGTDESVETATAAPEYKCRTEGETYGGPVEDHARQFCALAYANLDAGVTYTKLYARRFRLQVDPGPDARHTIPNMGSEEETINTCVDAFMALSEHCE
jgi:hypothetical protein